MEIVLLFILINLALLALAGYCNRARAPERLSAVILALLFALLAGLLHRQLAVHIIPALVSFLSLTRLVKGGFFLAWFMNLLLIAFFLICRPLFHRLWLHLIGRLRPDGFFPGYYRRQDALYLRHRLAGVGRMLRWSGGIAALFFVLCLILDRGAVMLRAFLYPWSPFLLIILELGCYLDGAERKISESGRIRAVPPEGKLSSVFDGIYHRYVTWFDRFMLDHRIYRKSFPGQNPEALTAILDHQNLILTDTYNDRVLPALGEIIDATLRQGGQIIVTATEESLLHEMQQALSRLEQMPSLAQAMITGERIGRHLRDGELYDLIFLRTELIEELWEKENFQALCPHLQLVIVPYATEQGLESFAAVDHVFSHCGFPQEIRYVIVGEKYSNIEETVKRIYHLPSAVEVQTLAQRSFKRYLILWDAEPDAFYHEMLISGANYIPPPTVLSVPPSLAGLKDIIWLKNGPFEKDSIETLRGHLRSDSRIPEFAAADLDPQTIRLLRGFKVFDQSPRRFLFVFDDMHNLPFLLHYLDKHDRAETDFVNILSPRYLLRSYFLAHLDYFVSSAYSEKLFPVITWPEASVKGTLYSLFRMLQRSHDGISVHRLQNLFFADRELWRKIAGAETFDLDRDLISAQMETFDDLKADAGNLIESYRWDPGQARMCKFISLQGALTSPDFADYFTFIDEETGDQVLTDQSISRDNLAYLYKRNDQIAIRNPGWARDEIKYYAIRSIDYAGKRIRVAHENPEKPNRHLCAVELKIGKQIALEKTLSQKGAQVFAAGLFLLSYHRRITHLLMCRGCMGPHIRHCSIEPDPSAWFPAEIIERDFSHVHALTYEIAAPELAGRTAPIAYTLSVLLKHIFRSLFPLAHAQLHVYSPQAAALFAQEEPEHIAGVLRLMTTRVDGLPGGETPGRPDGLALWIIEESEIGLGVVKYLERNHRWLWEIVQDYLHFLIEEKPDDDYLWWGLEKEQRGMIPYDFPGALLAADAALVDHDHTLHAERKRWQPLGNVEQIASRYEQAETTCDFCSGTIADRQFTILSDGRVRCEACSARTVNSIHELRELHDQAREEIKKLFKVEIPRVEELEFRDALYLQAQPGREFHPTSQFDPRAVGLAFFAKEKGEENCRIVIENGAPAWHVFFTLVHELTHIWQYFRLQTAHFQPDQLEGHAAFVEYRVLEAERSRRDDPALAQMFDRLKAMADDRTGDAGRGLAAFLENDEMKRDPFRFMIKQNGD
jgi:hypothetical protein